MTSTWIGLTPIIAAAVLLILAYLFTGGSQK